MTKCPQCDDDAIWVTDRAFCVKFDGAQIIYPRKVPAFCNDSACDQRYWWYPKTGRITKRNIGEFAPFLARKVLQAATGAND